ncbi:MAG: response regulator transcription factor [Deltaproteobacteria bacterium]|nr:response regulator transcription factor [Deltaproteobacteria bacterium]
MLIIDDHPLFREGLKAIIGRTHSLKTVENHKSNILRKLNIHSTLELVRYAARLGIIDVDLWKG